MTESPKLAVRVVGALALLLVARQRLRRAWRALWWRVLGVLNWRWRCQLCDARGPRAAERFCRTCWDDGLGGGLE